MSEGKAYKIITITVKMNVESKEAEVKLPRLNDLNPKERQGLKQILKGFLARLDSQEENGSKWN